MPDNLDNEMEALRDVRNLHANRRNYGNLRAENSMAHGEVRKAALDKPRQIAKLAQSARALHA